MSEKEFRQMSEQERRAERFKHFASSDYRPSEAKEADARGAQALEYLAFRMGRIDDKLSELIELLKASNAGRDKPPA